MHLESRKVATSNFLTVFTTTMNTSDTSCNKHLNTNLCKYHAAEKQIKHQYITNLFNIFRIYLWSKKHSSRNSSSTIPLSRNLNNRPTLISNVLVKVQIFTTGGEANHITLRWNPHFEYTCCIEYTYRYIHMYQYEHVSDIIFQTTEQRIKHNINDNTII